jgi:hypothetical protein
MDDDRRSADGGDRGQWPGCMGRSTTLAQTRPAIILGFAPGHARRRSAGWRACRSRTRSPRRTLGSFTARRPSCGDADALLGRGPAWRRRRSPTGGYNGGEIPCGRGGRYGHPVPCVQCSTPRAANPRFAGADEEDQQFPLRRNVALRSDLLPTMGVARSRFKTRCGLVRQSDFPRDAA